MTDSLLDASLLNSRILDDEKDLHNANDQDPLNDRSFFSDA